MEIGSVRSENEDGADTTAYLQAMNHPRRRRTLDILDGRDRPLDLMELTQRIRAASEDTEQNDTERIRLTLYHRHIPKLEETGFVEFDLEGRTVALTEQAKETLR